MSERDAVLELARAGAEALERSRRRLDDLNVYPVPDGDTGTNLSLTARAVIEALEAADELDDARTLIASVARAALLGARGNSGVILSQMLRGAVEVLGEADRLGATEVALALRGASDAAYRAVREPQEGTMLTAIRELAEEAERRASAGGDLSEHLRALVRHGDEAVARTPEQLAVLREAGVVDAGAAGVVELFRGLVAAALGEPAPAPRAGDGPVAPPQHQEPSHYRYCTGFVVEGSELDAERLERELEPLGDSLFVVGDPSALKVHLHTDDPGAALRTGTSVGVVEHVEIANMHRQAAEREARLAGAASAPEERATSDVVAVVSGAGNLRLFESLGARRVVEGGQTMNPAAADIVAAAESTAADGVVVLPNNENVVLAAEQAARLASCEVEVVPTKSIQAGLAAMVAFDPTLSAAENAAAMREAAAAVATASVTVASRDVELNGVAVAEGAYLGLLDGELVAGGSSFDEVAGDLVARLLAEPRDLLTLLTGAEEPPLEPLLGELEERYPELELEVHEGGQPHYPLLLSAE